MRFPWRTALLLLLQLTSSQAEEEDSEGGSGKNSLSCTICMVSLPTLWLGIFHEITEFTVRAGLGTAGGVAAISAAPLALTAAGSQLLFVVFMLLVSVILITSWGKVWSGSFLSCSGFMGGGVAAGSVAAGMQATFIGLALLYDYKGSFIRWIGYFQSAIWARISYYAQAPSSSLGWVWQSCHSLDCTDL